MTKLRKRFAFIIIIMCCLTTLTLNSDIFLMPSNALAAEKTPTDFSSDADDTTIATIVTSLLTNQSYELDEIELESQEIAQYMLTNIPNLQSKTQEINNEFRNISLIYQSSKTAPTELNILAKQNHRLLYTIRSIYAPFKKTQNQVNMRLEQLSALAENLGAMEASSVTPMLKRVAVLTKTYKKISNTLKQILPQTEKIIEKMIAINITFEENMPSLWLNYYLGNALNMFNENVWENELTYLSQIWTTASLTLISELPPSLYAWFLLALRTSVACIVLAAFLYASLKATILLPPVFHNTWKSILKRSMPWLVLGISLQYGAWNNDSVYQIVASVGTIFLCFGQIRCAWQLFSMNREKECLKESPFTPMLLTLLVSLLLLTFTPFPLTITLFWIVFLAFMIMRLYKKKKSNFPIPRYLMHGFVVILVLGVFIAPTGFARFSIFLTLMYICFAIGIHQATACLYVSSIVHDYLPKHGIPALISSLLLSIVMPIALLLAMFSPLAWIFAYPGGEYLIKNFGNFDFNIGTISFNTMQVLSIFIIFYLVRSLISISCSYIDNSWNKGTSAVASLATPIKTTIIFGLWGLFGLYVLNVIGFSLTSLAVIAGGLSVGIGLGLQGFVQNIFSGFSLIFGQTIREGDVVSVTAITGTVQKVSLRATQVRTYDNAIVFVPNSEFLATTFTNWTHNGRMVRCSLPIGVAYGSNLEIVMETALNAAKEQENVLKYPEPSIFFINFAGSSLDFELLFWIREIEDRMSMLTKVRLALNKTFKEHNIEIPFPQTDIYIRNAAVPTLPLTPAEAINTENVNSEILQKNGKNEEKNCKHTLD